MGKPFEPIHKHLLIKATVESFTETPGIANKFLVDLVELVGMKPVTFPQSAMVDEEGNKGLTGSINLATSHIAYHHWSETGLLMLDLYSCCEFDPKIVIDFIDNFAKIKDIQFIVIDRTNMEIIDEQIRNNCETSGCSCKGTV